MALSSPSWANHYFYSFKLAVNFAEPAQTCKRCMCRPTAHLLLQLLMTGILGGRRPSEQSPVDDLPTGRWAFRAQPATLITNSRPNSMSHFRWLAFLCCLALYSKIVLTHYAAKDNFSPYPVNFIFLVQVKYRAQAIEWIRKMESPSRDILVLVWGEPSNIFIPTNETGERNMSTVILHLPNSTWNSGRNELFRQAKSLRHSAN